MFDGAFVESRLKGAQRIRTRRERCVTPMPAGVLTTAVARSCALGRIAHALRIRSLSTRLRAWMPVVREDSRRTRAFDARMCP
jgi:hypothetical protein